MPMIYAADAKLSRQAGVAHGVHDAAVRFGNNESAITAGPPASALIVANCHQCWRRAGAVKYVGR